MINPLQSGFSRGSETRRKGISSGDKSELI